MEQTLKLIFTLAFLSYWIWEGFTERETWRMSSGSQKRTGIYHFWRLLETGSIDLTILTTFSLGSLFTFIYRWFPEQPWENFPWSYLWLYLGVRILGYTLYEAVFTLGQSSIPLETASGRVRIFIPWYKKLWYKPHPWKLFNKEYNQPSRFIFSTLFLLGLILTIRFI